MAPAPHPLQSICSMQGDKLPKSPHTFGDAINARLDSPFVTLFTLGIRLLQLVFSLAAGISYAIELSQGNTSATYIYSQVVFGLTCTTLFIDALTLRSYRLTFVVESTLCILWLALFGRFYQTFVGMDEVIDPEHMSANKGRMKAAVWLDLVNFLLWLASALFSTAMCCSGTKAMIRGKLEKRRVKKRNSGANSVESVEIGTLDAPAETRTGDRLPLYEEITRVVARN
jgi:hypothetical protein